MALVCFNIGAICPPQNNIISHFSCSSAALRSGAIKVLCKGNGRNAVSLYIISLAILLVTPRPSLPVKARDSVVCFAASENSICLWIGSALDSSVAKNAVPICAALAPNASAAATPLPFAMPPAAITGIFTFSLMSCSNTRPKPGTMADARLLQNPKR